MLSYHRIALLHSLGRPDLHFDVSTMAAPNPADVERGDILRLQEIEVQPTLKLAHGRWQSGEAELKERIAKYETQVSNLTNEIYQLLGFVSAFQGLLLTAVAQASQLKCHNVGIPLALSLFATTVTLAGVWQKKGIVTELKRNRSKDERVRMAFTTRIEMLEEQGGTFNYNDLPQVSNLGMAGPAGTCCSSKWVTYNNGVAVCVLLLGGICSLFIYRVLCDA